MVNHPLRFSVDYPERLSRGLVLLKFLFGWLYVGIPHGIILWLYGIAVSVVVFISWWAILFTARYPKWAYDFVLGFIRWELRVKLYVSYFMTDVYPPFSTEE